jgi:FSR family fosmidomycin resistance protein-like MFS transporter
MSLPLAAGVAVAVGICWLAVVTAAPGRLQPWALGSTNGSAVDATFVYNGVERIDSTEPARARALPAPALAARPDPPGPFRLAGAGATLDLRLGAELVPALLAGLAAFLIAARSAIASRRGAAPSRLARAGALALATWLLTGLVVFTFMRGLQVRYLEAFAPAVAGALGVGVVALGRRLRAPAWAIAGAIAVLLALIFSKYFYLASLTSYYTFYLISRFHVSVQSAQLHLFVFLAAVAFGTIIGGPLGDRVGRKYIIWASILGVLPFSLLLPHANLFWTGVLTVPIGIILASAFPAIVVYAQELMPGRTGTVAGLFFGFAFGMGGIGAAVLGKLADAYGINTVYELCAFLPLIGLLAALLPDVEQRRARALRA